MGVKFGVEEGTFGPLLHAEFHPHRCNVSPLPGEKPQNGPLSKLNTGRFALRAMLPVINPNVRATGNGVRRCAGKSRRHPLSKCPFPWGDLDPHLIHGSLGPPESTSQTASRSVQFSRFCRAHGRYRQTDRQTDHATPSVAISCI